MAEPEDYELMVDAKGKAQDHDPFLAAAELCEGSQATLPPVNSPVVNKGKSRSDSVIDYPTPTATSSESSIDSSSATPESIAEPTYGPSVYFNSSITGFNPNAVDLNKIGILYEYTDCYFVVVEVPHPNGGKKTLRRAFMRRDHAGPYLRSEWSSLPEVRTGQHGFGALAEKGRWPVQSKMIQHMRAGCVTAAKFAECQARAYLEENGKAMADELYRGVLEVALARMVDGIYGAVLKREAEAQKEGEAFMSEVMVFEE